MEITGIIKENMNGFLSVIPEDIVLTEDLVAGAIEDNRAVGACAFSVLKGTATLILDYIYVDPDYRRKGIATALLNDMVERTKPFAVHVVFKNDEELIPFFTRAGFELARESEAYEVKAKDMISSNATNRLLGGKHTETIVKISKLSDAQVKALNGAILQAGIDQSVSDEALNSSISFASIAEGSDMPEACILCSDLDDDIMVRLLFSSTGDYSTLGGLFKTFYKELEKQGLADKKLVFTTDEESLISLIVKMSNGKAQNTAGIICGIKEYE